MERLFDLAEKGSVLVFPTETAARSFAVEYTLKTGNGILASSAIAFDRFKNILYKGLSSEHVKPAHRFIFSVYTADSLYDRMKYFRSDKYPEAHTYFVSFFRTMLSGLNDTNAEGIAGEDIAMLRKEYLGFLEAMGLHDIEYIDPDLSFLGDAEYYIINSDAFTSERGLWEKIKDDPRIKEFNGSEYPGELNKYSNEALEIRAMFVNINNLIQEGVNYEDIVITAGGAERLKYRLLSESKLFDIPLVFVGGSSPIDLPAGAFFKALSQIYESGYEISELKSFFLNPHLPFRDPEMMRRFIMKAVDGEYVAAPDPDDDPYLAIGEEDGLSLYTEMRGLIDLLMNERDGSKVHAIMEKTARLLFTDDSIYTAEEFTDDDKKAEAKPYEYILKEMENFISALSASEDAGFKINRPVFPLFIDYLRTLKYSSSEKTDGIRVYPFPMDAATYSEHRFIISLNVSECSKRAGRRSFLSECEARETTETDITPILLSSYRTFSGHLTLSATENSYDGARMPLPGIECGVEISGIIGDDPWNRDCHRALKVHELQKKSFERAEYTAMLPIPKEEDLTRLKKGKPIEGPINLSFTMIDAYRVCPFKYAMKYRFNISENEKFDVGGVDHATIGNKLHNVMQRYFNGEGEIEKIFEKEMKSWKESTAEQQSYVRNRYLGNLRKIAEKISDKYRKKATEWNSGKKEIDDDVFLSGRIDFIGESDDSLAIIDYKKTNPGASDENKNYQFSVYELLLSMDSNYRGFEKTDKFFAGFDNGNLTEIKEGKVTPGSVAKEEIIGYASSMRNGEWAHKCEAGKSCGFRGICRRKFNVQ